MFLLIAHLQIANSVGLKIENDGTKETSGDFLMNTASRLATWRARSKLHELEMRKRVDYWDILALDERNFPDDQTNLSIVLKDIDRSDLAKNLRGKLLNVLKATALSARSGYVQGMNLIAARLLEIGLTESEAFYALAFLLNDVAVEYFDEGFPGMQRDSVLLQRLLRKCLIRFDEDAFLAFAARFLPSLGTAHLDKVKLVQVWDMLLVYGRPGWLALVAGALGVDCRPNIGMSHLLDVEKLAAKVTKYTAGDILARSTQLLPEVLLLVNV